jgi:hypothetical protein
MTFRGLEEVDSHGINQRKIPRSFVFGGRLQLGHGQARIGMPRHITDVVGAERCQVGECGVMDR